MSSKVFYVCKHMGESRSEYHDKLEAAFAHYAWRLYNE